MPKYLIEVGRVKTVYETLVVEADSEGEAFSAISGVDLVMQPPYEKTRRKADIVAPKD